MIKFNTVEGKEVEFDSLAKLFATDKGARGEQMSLFGTYIAAPKDKQLNLSAVADKVEEQTKACNCYIANLKTLGEVVATELKEEARKKIADKKPEEVAADVDYMTQEQLAALKAAIEAKENQQQN